jgi:hypothetical protein
MVHSWEFTYVPTEKRTKSWYHSKAFREKMAEFGILCEPNGVHAGLDHKARFVHILRQHAVSLKGLYMGNASAGIAPIDIEPKKKGKSKLRKWQCPCGQTARIGKKEFFATCDLCRKKFELTE